MEEIRYIKMIKFFVGYVVVFFLLGCDGSFISQTKDGLPNDHTLNFNGVFHKDGAQYPFSYDPSTKTYLCGGPKCHGNNLRGGIAEVDGVKKVAPSCYQCHGQFWIGIDTTFTKY